MQDNLNRRVGLARKAAEAGVLQKIDGGYRVPSRTLVYHHIVFARFYRDANEAGYRMTCHYELDDGTMRCPGNQFGHICWHCLAAMVRAAPGPIAFFEDKAGADRYARLGGKLVAIRSGDGSGKLWAVVRGA